MEEKWMICNIKADFGELAKTFGLDPLTVRLMVNRGADTEEKIRRYLKGDQDDLYDPALLKDAEKAADILAEAIRAGKKLAVASDFDCDGIFSGRILQEALELLGAEVKILTPDRLSEGYGLNRRIADEAAAFGADLLLTCDNGISAFDAVDYALSLGMTVIVTDHHEVTIENGAEKLPAAAAVVDPHQADCPYPFKNICGAVVVLKLMQLLFEKMGRSRSELEPLTVYAAIATVADVMELTDENRILVREGLKRMNECGLPAIDALKECCGLSGKKLTAYHLGFVIGPCFNAAGRLETVELAQRLLAAGSTEEALPLAEELRGLNEIRKKLTAEGAARAEEKILTDRLQDDPVLVVYLPDCHESVVGIIAGRLKEAHHRPALVITGRGEHCKGSGRSVEAYSMYEKMAECRELFNSFGGHPMAAGFSLKEENIAVLRRELNDRCGLTTEDLKPVVRIDALMPPEYVTAGLIREFSLLEPFGKGNEQPLFARSDLELTEFRVLGEKKNAVRFRLKNPAGASFDAIWFGDASRMEEQIVLHCGSKALTALERRQKSLPAALAYCPSLNEYMGRTSIQFVIKNLQLKK